MCLRKTVVLRHRKENLQKCSLRGLEKREDFTFYTYPRDQVPFLENYILLDMQGEPLSIKDKDSGIFLIDATWKYAEKMRSLQKNSFILRSIPSSIQTAYPRKQTGCEDPKRGLASVEALYVAYKILGRDPKGLLDNYYWKDQFISLNKF